MPRTDTASRVIIAPHDQVYAALVDPRALAAWLPPRGMTGGSTMSIRVPAGCMASCLVNPAEHLEG